ncbi:DUF1992 domain-containing protein [Mobilicoccus caccae]|uniref:DnaJ homologue subfamily C member 28 conserved domain-containing protein n=1 Tax=Mobilicoccus caccae TaxID=1859295 RepID=A0ABQ6IR18_9MICO|nr:DUF1992 domain-containing protein [Mobilicoccus caccae]GMA40370.1 hypothetical protein GCM10025883_24150 [Mobilicoccus caccae]
MVFHESWVERQIREATERGEFDGLPGSGKPLDLHDVDDPDWWVKRFLDREGLDASATMPPVMQLRAEHAGFPASLVDVTREDAVREILRDYNRRVVEDRLRPVIGRAMPVVAPRVDVDEMVSHWRELRDLRALDEIQEAPTQTADSSSAPPRPGAFDAGGVDCGDGDGRGPLCARGLLPGRTGRTDTS